MTNRLSEAENLHQRGRHIYEQAMGANHPLLTRFLIKLAVLYRNSNQQEEVERVLEQVQSICTASVEGNHPDAAEALCCLAGWYKSKSVR